MNIIFQYIILTCVFSLSSIYLPAQNQNVKYKDLNNDGFKETIKITKDGGSSLSSETILIKNGKTKKVNKLEFWNDYSNLFSVVPIPEWVNQNGYNKTEVLRLITSSKYQTPDPSLYWLLTTKVEEEKDSTLSYHQKLKYIVKWNPVIKSIINENSSVSLINPSKGEFQNSLLKENMNTSLVWIFYSDYMIKNGRGFRRGSTTNDYFIVPPQYDSVQKLTLYTLAHGIYISNESNKYSWVFICDETIESDHQKLRLGAIEQAYLFGSKILFHYHSSGNYLFVADYKSGVIKRYDPISFGLTSLFESFEVINGNVILEGENGEQKKVSMNIF
jgi:hypothetical protein